VAMFSVKLAGDGQGPATDVFNPVEQRIVP
jgi:hypothetical protein